MNPPEESSPELIPLEQIDPTDLYEKYLIDFYRNFATPIKGNPLREQLDFIRKNSWVKGTPSSVRYQVPVSPTPDISVDFESFSDRWFQTTEEYTKEACAIVQAHNGGLFRLPPLAIKILADVICDNYPEMADWRNNHPELNIGINDGCVVRWNDSREREQEEVEAMLEKAAVRWDEINKV